MTITFKQPRLTGKLAFMAALAAFGAGASAPSLAAQASANASATVVAPIAVAAVVDLVFGSFAPGAGGSVTVSTSGVRTASGPVLLTATPSSAARFNITGQAGATYSIVHTGTVVLTNTIGAGGETMALTKFSDLTGANATSGTATSGTLSGLGAQSLFVGGTLAVGPTQVAGLYTGTVVATVEYN